MSKLHAELCTFLIKERCPLFVQTVAYDLLICGPKSLKLLYGSIALPKENIRQALCLLIQYGMASFRPSRNPDVAEYAVNADKILVTLRHSRYLMLMKRLYGNEAEMIVEGLLRNGSSSMTQIIANAYIKLRKDAVDGGMDKNLIVRLRDHFEVLVNKQYIQRCPEVCGGGRIPDLVNDPAVSFTPVKIELSSIISQVEKSIIDGSDSVLWCVHHPRLHQDMRDDILVSAMTRRVSPQAGEALRLLLRQAYLVSAADAPHSNAITVTQLVDYCRKTKHDSKYLDDYLVLMAEDESKFILRDDRISAPAYQVNTRHAIEELTWNLLANAVEARLGTNAARIFRLIRQQIYIEQDEIQKKAMIPDKEGKLLTYNLVQGGWVQQHELRKGVQKAGPSKTFYLFCIDLNQVVRMYIEMCYRSLLNCAKRREFEHIENKTLLDKHQRTQAITLQMTGDGSPDEDIAEIASLITPPEAALVEKVHTTLNKLHQAEIEIDETLFILQLYLQSRK